MDATGLATLDDLPTTWVEKVPICILFWKAMFSSIAERLKGFLD